MHGLTEREAAERLRLEGGNELPSPDRRSALRIIGEVLGEPMFGLLAAAAVIYLILGEAVDALVLAAFATISVSIAVIQEARSERVLEALRDLTSPRALVIRDGLHRRIPGREVVRGDLLVLEDGDRVPADAMLVSGDDMLVDESLLTGESVAVRKRVAEGSPPASTAPGGDGLPYVFAGTLVVGGAAKAVVTAIGVNSEIGKIGRSLGTIEREPPRLQVETRRIVKVAAIIGLLVSIVTALLYALFRESLLQAILAGIAVSMSMLPEEFPLVLTVFMVMGAWRISRARVLTRRSAAIETLGAATVLCTDKTGTLTQNRMSVARIQYGAETWGPGADDIGPLSEAMAVSLDTAAMACAHDGFDPMDRAIDVLATARRPVPETRELVRHHGLTRDLLAEVNVWREDGTEGFVAAAKGAPEAIAELSRLSEAERAEMASAIDEMAAEGMRVLGLARASFAGAESRPLPRDMPFRFQGLIGFADPLRDTVPASVQECRSAGIRVVMVTGDYPSTALAIARQAGIDAADAVSGPEMERMGDEALRDRVRTAHVFARTTPAQKLRIVEALKANGEIVGMTGDGVNDAPSLKAAHIGIAMGQRGTDVAREAAAIVLLDDDFGSIVHTVRLGRRIYDNLRKAMGYIVAVHVPIAGLALLPIALGMPLVLTPMLIAFLEMIIDPGCSVVLEAEVEEKDVMNRPPRDPRRPLLPLSLVAWNLLQGALAFLVISAIFLAGWRHGLPESEVRSLAFLALVVTNIALLLGNRSFGSSLWTVFTRPNPSLWLGLGGVAVMLLIVLGWAPARKLFGLGPLHADDLALCFAGALGLLLLLEAIKPFWRNRLQS